MEEVHCPNCASPLRRGEIAAAQCDMCGERLSPDLLHTAAERRGGHPSGTGLVDSVRTTLRKLTCGRPFWSGLVNIFRRHR